MEPRELGEIFIACVDGTWVNQDKNPIMFFTGDSYLQPWAINGEAHVCFGSMFYIKLIPTSKGVGIYAISSIQAVEGGLMRDVTKVNFHDSSPVTVKELRKHLRVMKLQEF